MSYAVRVLCRPAVGARTGADYTCDVPENCTGASNTCPGDGFKPATTLCRRSGGPCDPIEYCTSTSNACPDDAIQAAGATCKAAGGTLCDPADTCDGHRKTCPASYAPAGVDCGGGKSCNGLGQCR